jgi:Phosphate-selective porin O and P
MSHTFFHKTLLFVIACAMLALVTAPAFAQLQVKTEDITLKFGFQGQFWADWTQDATAASAGNQGYAQNFYLLRARLMFGGTIGDNIDFFFQTDDPKLGLSPSSTAASKTLTTGNSTSPGFIIQDAWAQYRFSKYLQIAAGEMLVPNSRQALQSTLSYYTVNISSISTVANSSLVESALRDVGFQARGYFLDDRLQYRGGIFAGERDADGRNAPRPAAYLQYDFFDREKEYAYAGTALGKRKILAIDVGGDKQQSYRSMSANLANDLPVFGGDEIGFNYQFIHWDGRQKFTAIPDQNDQLVEAAYYVHKAKLQPFAKFETQNFVQGVNSLKDVNRIGTGANYYIHGQNLKWTFQYTRALPQNGSTIRPSNEFTTQLQVFYF